LADQLKDDKYDNTGIIICWHHGKIPNLALALGVDEGDLPYPVKGWPSDVFDQVWQIEYHKKKVKIAAFTQNIEIPSNFKQ